MTREFLPDYSFAPINGAYRPLYKLYQDEAWRMVLDRKRPVECSSAGAAIMRAKDHVRAILNPSIRVERSADVLGIEDWRRKKAEAVEQERASVFSGLEGKMFRRGREITIERRRAR